MLPGTATRGNIHFLTTLRATAAPLPRLIARDDRFHGQDGNGLALGLMLVAAFAACLGAAVWAGWPVIAGVLRAVSL